MKAIHYSLEVKREAFLREEVFGVSGTLSISHDSALRNKLVVRKITGSKWRSHFQRNYYCTVSSHY